MPRVVASIEARMGSSRLPGKVLADVRGKPALSRLLDRLNRCRRLDGIVLATSTHPQDDPVAAWAASEGVFCHRGSEEDVLRRVVEAQRMLGSEIVVEVCGDMTLLDPELTDMGIVTFLENECDVVTTACKPSYPVGADVVVCRLIDLEWVEGNARDPEFREHVALYLFRHPEKYRILHLFAPRRLEDPECRLVLDYPEDLEFIRTLYERLEPAHGGEFGLPEIMELLRKDPQLREINRHCGKETPS
ncbi:MAG: glycosyltransferase family protein [Thermodesulfobacteriota bacterium]